MPAISKRGHGQRYLSAADGTTRRQAGLPSGRCRNSPKAMASRGQSIPASRFYAFPAALQVLDACMGLLFVGAIAIEQGGHVPALCRLHCALRGESQFQSKLLQILV